MTASRKLCNTILAVGAPLALATLAMTPSQVFGQAAEFGIEGPWTDVVDNGDGTFSIIIMGVDVVIDSQTVINSPTASLDVADLEAAPPLPGRRVNGFIDGTAIVGAGESVAGQAFADDLFVEPSENGIVGQRTPSQLGDPLNSLRVNGLLVRLLEDGTACVAADDGTAADQCDERIPGQGTTFAGFAITPDSIPDDTLVAADGYFASGALYAFVAEADAGDFVNPGAEASVTRAECRDRTGTGRDELSVLGATHTPNSGTVRIQISESEAGPFVNLAGANTAAVVADPEVPGIGEYRFERRNLTFLAPARCPNFVRVEFVGQGGVFSPPFAVAVRED